MFREKIGFGIIGLGNVAATQAYALEHSAYCYLAAVYSPSEEKGRKYSDFYRCRHYTDLHDFLSDRSVSVVVISTPSGLHRDIALECLKKSASLSFPYDFLTSFFGYLQRFLDEDMLTFPKALESNITVEAGGS